MILDLSQGFEFSRLKSSLPWAFSQQAIKMKINGITVGSATLKQYESYHNILKGELFIVFFFLEMILFFILLTIGQTNFNKSYSQISKNNMIKPLLIWLI